MKVLVFTHMYPTGDHPQYGIFVQQQVASLQREGVETDVLFVNPMNSKWNYPLSVFPFLKRVYSRDYDLIHAHYVLAGIVARSQFRRPLILTHHGDETFHGWQKPLCRGISRLSRKVIVPSRQIKEAIGMDNAVIIPCGVDFDLFKPMDKKACRKALGMPLNKKLVLFAGDFHKRLKRFDLIRQAVALVQKEMQDADFAVAFNQPYQKIPLYMNACDVLILASEREGSPQVVKEAMACNLPVVSVDAGDVSEIFSGVDGCRMCERNPEDMAANIISVLALQRRSNGRERTRRFEIRNIARRIIKEYENVLRNI